MTESSTTGRYCDLLYRHYENELGKGRVRARCVPHEGVFLYEVCATYAKPVSAVPYYVLGKTEAEARRRVRDWYGLTVVTVRLIPPGAEAETILTDPLRMPTK